MYRQNDYGLTARQEQFAKCLAIGMAQKEAFRRCFPHRGKSDSAIESAAHRNAAKPKVVERIKSFLAEAKASDLQSAGDWMSDLLDGIAKAKSADNWTAFAALKRLSGQALGLLNETVTVRAEQSMSDETLVKQLGKADPVMATKLTLMLGGKAKVGEKS